MAFKVKRDLGLTSILLPFRDWYQHVTVRGQSGIETIENANVFKASFPREWISMTRQPSRRNQLEAWQHSSSRRFAGNVYV